MRSSRPGRISAESCDKELISKLPRGEQEKAYDNVRPIRSSEDNHAVELLDAVHLSQETHEDAVAGRAAAFLRATRRSQSVDLVLRVIPSVRGAQ